MKITHFTKKKARERFYKWAEKMIESTEITDEQRELIIKCVEKGHVPNNLLMGMMTKKVSQ